MRSASDLQRCAKTRGCDTFFEPSMPKKEINIELGRGYQGNSRPRNWDLTCDNTDKMLKSLTLDITTYKKLIACPKPDTYSCARQKKMIEKKFNESESTLKLLERALASKSKTIEMDQRRQKLTNLFSLLYDMRKLYLQKRTTKKTLEERRKNNQRYSKKELRDNIKNTTNSEMQQQQQCMIDQQNDVLTQVIQPYIEQLKVMSMDLGEEFDVQSGLLEEIEDITESADIKMRRETKQMKNIKSTEEGWYGLVVIFTLMVIILFLLMTNWACYIFNPRRC